MATTANVARNGDIIRWEIPVTNNGAQDDTNVVVSGAYPAGVLYTSHDPVTGTTFNTSTPQWDVPELPKNTTKTLVVYTKVTDITLAPFVWTLTVTGDNVDSNAGNDTLILTVNSTTCPPSAGAVPDTTPHVGDVSENDTPCSQCDTEYHEDVASTVNLTINNFDQTTGKFDVTLDNPTIAGTFEYSLWCMNCPDGMDYETSGPATVTIPAYFSDASYFGGLTEYDSMAEAIIGEGNGKPFLYSADNDDNQGYRALFVTPLA